MQRTKDPLRKAALQLHQRLTQRGPIPDRQRQRSWDTVLDQVQQVSQRLSLAHRARCRHWHAAGAMMERRASDVLHELKGLLTEVLPSVGDRCLQQPVVLRDLYQDLLQLKDEFDEVEFDLRHHLIIAVTPSIELEDIHLGTFRIELHLDRLVEQANASAFDLIALQPNPADSNDDVTHPHVRDRQLCAGDATVPIARALEQGRITDAFMAVRSVLQTYNAGSPYVPLSDWHGQPCSDCGYTVGPDDSRYCDGCRQDFCEECIGWCDVCESSYCHNCLEEDTQSGRSCCPSCRHRCDKCHRVVDADSFVEETGLCPECHEERTQTQEKENDNDSNDLAASAESHPGGPAQSNLAENTLA